MKQFITKTAVVLLIVMLLGPAALAGDQKSCYFAFGSGVVEQVLVPPGMPQNPYLGPIHLRIGRVHLDGWVDMVITGGFDVPTFNPAVGEMRLTGFGMATFDFGDLGAFHTWEVDTSTLIGPPPYKSSTLQGDIRTGPARDATPGGPPGAWGEGFFAHADGTFKGYGWNHFQVINKDGLLVNEFTYYLWGKICNIDMKGIRTAQRS